MQCPNRSDGGFLSDVVAAVVIGKDYRAQSFDITYPSGGSITKEAWRALKLIIERMPMTWGNEWEPGARLRN